VSFWRYFRFLSSYIPFVMSSIHWRWLIWKVKSTNSSCGCVEAAHASWRTWRCIPLLHRLTCITCSMNSLMIQQGRLSAHLVSTLLTLYLVLKLANFPMIQVSPVMMEVNLALFVEILHVNGTAVWPPWSSSESFVHDPLLVTWSAGFKRILFLSYLKLMIYCLLLLALGLIILL